MAELNRIAGPAAELVVGVMAASVPLKSASAENDYWGHHHRDWNNSGGSFHFNTGPGHYYAPPPAYYYPDYGPSFGFSVRVH